MVPARLFIFFFVWDPPFDCSVREDGLPPRIMAATPGVSNICTPPPLLCRFSSSFPQLIIEFVGTSLFYFWYEARRWAFFFFVPHSACWSPLFGKVIYTIFECAGVLFLVSVSLFTVINKNEILTSQRLDCAHPPFFFTACSLFSSMIGSPLGLFCFRSIVIL